MSDVAALIADMVRAGVDPELIGRTAEALSQREAVVVQDEAAERRRAKDRERKRLRNSAEVGGNGGTPSPKESPQTPKETPPSTHKETPLRGSKKGSRLPDDFEPDFAFATGLGLTSSQAATEFAKFRDYWSAKAGQGATKRDWQATWRNWVRTTAERMPRQRAGPSSAPSSPFEHFRNYASELNGQDRDDRGGGSDRNDAPGIPLRTIEHHG